MGTPALLLEEIRTRTRWRGSSRDVARSFGISRSHLLGIRNGNAELGLRAAERILASIRTEELELADRIEAEMNAHWLRNGQ